MLRDTNPNYFAGIYIVCCRTDLRYGIDSLAAIIKQKYKLSLFVPNTLFLFAADLSQKSKGKRDSDLDGLPVRIIEHRLSAEELADKFPNGYKELPA